MTPQNSQLTKRPPSAVLIDGKLYPVHVVKQSITQHDIDRPAQYQTVKSRELPTTPTPLPKLPSVLSLTLSAIIALCFLVTASMFSISLTAYSNSVDRVDRSRSFIQVD